MQPCQGVNLPPDDQEKTSSSGLNMANLQFNVLQFEQRSLTAACKSLLQVNKKTGPGVIAGTRGWSVDRSKTLLEGLTLMRRPISGLTGPR